MAKIAVHFQGKHSISQLSKTMCQPLTMKKLKLNDSMKIYKPTRTNAQKIRPIPTEDMNAKVRRQEIPGITCKFGLEGQNDTGQSLTEFCKENALLIANTFFQQCKKQLYTWISTDGQHWNKIDYILEAEDAEALTVQFNHWVMPISL